MSNLKDFFPIVHPKDLIANFMWTTPTGVKFPVVGAGFNRILYSSTLYNNIPGVVLQANGTITIPIGTFELALRGPGTLSNVASSIAYKCIRDISDDSLLGRDLNHYAHSTFVGESNFIMTFTAVTTIECAVYSQKANTLERPISYADGPPEEWATLFIKHLNV